MYEPSTARFLSADPLPPDQKQILLGTPNLYAYALNNPINNTDPSGTTVVFSSAEEANKFVQQLKDFGAKTVGVVHDPVAGFYHVYACLKDADAVFNYADATFPNVFKGGIFYSKKYPHRDEAERRARFLTAIFFSGTFSDVKGNEIEDFSYDPKVMGAIARALRKCNEGMKLKVDIGGEGGRDPDRFNCNVIGQTAGPKGTTKPIPRLVPKTEEIASPFPSRSADEVYIENVALDQDKFNRIVVDAARIVKIGGIIILVNAAENIDGTKSTYHDSAVEALKNAGYVIEVNSRTFYEDKVLILETTITVVGKRRG